MTRPRSILLLSTCILALQLGLLWVQGAQLHRQNRMITELHGDIQYLSETVDQLAQEHYAPEPESWSPASHRGRRVPQEEDPAAKELRQSQESARKAVEQARSTRKALSVEEAAKRAEEAEKIKAAENAWVRWIWIGLGAGLGALLLRAWWRSRG